MVNITMSDLNIDPLLFLLCRDTVKKPSVTGLKDLYPVALLNLKKQILCV